MRKEDEMDKATRFFYAAKSTMGTNFTYDSPCWSAYRFTSAKARDTWVADHEYKDGNRVAEKVSPKIAYKIIGYHESERYPMLIVKEYDGMLLAMRK
jgi:hypothetical protein